MVSRWYRRIGLCLIVVLGLLFLTPVHVQAAQRMTGSDVTVAKSQTVHDDLYIGAQTITINGTINGNLVAAGENITINGTVTGSVLAAASTLTLNGTVKHDLTFVGNSVKLNAESLVGRDVTYWGSAAHIAGKVVRDVSLFAGETAKLTSTASIGGTLSYVGDHRPTVASAQVAGGMEKVSGPAIEWPSWNGSFNAVAFGLVLWLRNLIGLFILGLLLVWLAPGLARRCTAEERRAPFGTLGWGFLTLITVPLAAVIALIVGIFIGGWWIALMLMGVFWTAITLGAVVSSLLVGQWLFARMRPASTSLTLSLLLGMAVLGVISLVPYMGALVAFLAAVWGLGALTVVAYQSGPWTRRSSQQTVPATRPATSTTIPTHGHPV